MKSLLRIFLLIPFVIACRSSVGIDDLYPDEVGNSVGFSAKVQTRAVSENDASVVQTNGFGVWGGYEGGTEAIFANTHVTYEDGTWGYDNTKYWTNNTYNFYAVYPASTDASYDASTGEFTITDYDIRNNVDLLIGAVEDHEYPLDGPTVNINFEHVLAQISFSAKKDEGAGTVKIKSAKFYGVPSAGTYTSSIEGWSHKSEDYTTNSLPFANKTTETEIETTATDVFGTPLLVFPSTHIPATYILYVEYAASGQESTSSMLLAAASLDKWEAGKKYNYTFTIIDKNTIIFDVPKVTPWAESNGNVIIVE